MRPLHRTCHPLLLVLALIGLGSLLPGLAQAGPEEVNEYKLSNGLKVLLIENHDAPVISFYVVYRVGSKNERPGITGISHLLEHMMFKTTAKHPLGDFDKLLQPVGAQHNASTWNDRTIYFETIPASAIDLSLELESDRMRGALMLAEDHRLEMPVVRNELEQDEDSPQGQLNDEMMANAFKAHPYGIPVIGWVDDVEGITATDLKEYYDRWYQPDNAFIVAVGDFNSAELYEKISQHFGPIPASGHVTPRLPQEPKQRGERRFTIKRSGDVDYLQIAWHIPDNRNKDCYALQVLASILGRGRTSRLYPAMVDSGLTTGASASSGGFNFSDPSLFELDASVSPGVDPATVEAALYAEVQRLIDDGVSPDELARAKKQERVNYVFAADNLASQARNLINFETYGGDWRRMYDYLPGIEAVTPADVQRVAAMYLTQDNRTVGLYDAQPSGEGEGGGPAADGRSSGHAYMPDPWDESYYGGVSMLPDTEVPIGSEISLGAELPSDYASVFTLSNGLTVVVRESHDNISVNMAGLVRAGSVDEPADKAGLASLAIGMLSRGTQEHSKQQLAEIAENDGIRLGFGAGRESFSVSGRCLSEDLGKMLDLLQAELLTPSFPPEELERLRQQTLAGLLEADNDTGTAARLAALAALYGEGHPYARLVDGTEEGVKSVTVDDIKTWYKTHSIPEGAILTFVGDVDTSSLREQLEQRLGAWTGTAADRSALLARSTEAHTPTQRSISLPMADKRDVSLLWLGPSGPVADYSLPTRQLANYIFGGGFTTRLNGRLRIAEGLTYGARSGFDDNLTPGLWSATAEVNAMNIAKARAATAEELAAYFKDGPTDEEIATARAYMSGSYEVRLASKSALVSALTDAVYRGLGVDYVRTYSEQVAAVSADDVRAVIRSAMNPDNLVYVEAGTLTE